MTRMLTDLQIDEVSIVDRGAGEGTRVRLFKRDTPTRKAGLSPSQRR